MFIGILQFELIVPDSQSLKDKRRVVKSVKDRLHREHLVSVAEIAALENHRLAVMGLAVVSNSEAYAAGLLDRVTAKLSRLVGAELGAVSRQIVRGEDVDDAEAEGPLWTEAERRAVERDAEALLRREEEP